jgi:hypothetical protein
VTSHTIRPSFDMNNSMMQRVALIMVCVFTVALSGCQTGIPRDALALSEQSLEWRLMQSRKFDTTDQELILNASVGLLQDLGFTIDETEGELGLIVGTKERSAVSAAQVTGAIIAALLGASVPTDHHQRFKASVVTRSYGETNESVIVRVTFQRVVWASNNQVTKIERINDEAMYLEFFGKLSKAVFLEAQQM